MTASIAGDVARGDGHEVGGDVKIGAEGGDTGGAEEVDLDGLIEGGVEGDGRRGVDHDVDGGEDLASAGVEAEPVAGHVAGDGGDPSSRELGESVLAVLLPQAVEGVVGEEFAFGAAGRRRSTSVPHEEHELAVGDTSEQTLHESRTDEPGRAGDGNPLSGERLGDHAPMSIRLSTKW